MIYVPGAFSEITLDQLMAAIQFEQRSVTVYGKTHPQPRLTKWYGPVPYTYSGLSWPTLPMPALLEGLRERVEGLTQAKFNCVLCNLYRDGDDTVGWHSDNEVIFGRVRDIEVASLSFGAARLFKMRRHDRTAPQDFNQAASYDYLLEHGSLLFMPAGTQSEWQHSLPRRRNVTEPRINLTFRRCIV